MNSARSFALLFRSPNGVSYTEQIMTGQSALDRSLERCPQEGNSSGQSRLAMSEVQMSEVQMSEVQICGIPKLSLGKVAPTP